MDPRGWGVGCVAIPRARGGVKRRGSQTVNVIYRC